jgi:ankyrin repeat protein
MIEHAGSVVDAQNRHGETPLYLACSVGRDMSVIRCLVEQGRAAVGARTNRGETPLHIVSHLCKWSLVGYLLQQRGADARVQTNAGCTLLHRACGSPRHHVMYVVTFLVDEVGVAVEALDNNGRTSLHWTCRYGDDFQVVRYLVEQGGAAADTQDHEGWTPLHVDGAGWMW